MKQWEKEFDKHYDDIAQKGYLGAKKVFKILLSSQKAALRKKIEEKKCDFNWDFEKGKAKHKSYIAIDDILQLIDEL